MTPSDLQWWAWLLITIGSAVFFVIAHATFESREQRGVGLSGPLAFVSGMVAAISAIITVIRFVKWVWAG